MAVNTKPMKRAKKAGASKSTQGLKATARSIKKISAGPSAKVPKAESARLPAQASAAPFMAGADVFSNVFKMPEMKLNDMERMMTKQNFQFDQIASEAANSSREGVEAFIKFGTIFAKGFEDIIRTAASLTQSSAEKQAEYAKQMMGAKTINEFATAQNKIAQASFDQMMANATKISEMSIKVINESIAPLNDQMVKGMNKATKMAA